MGSVNWSELQKAAGEASIDPVEPAIYDVFVDSAEAKQSGNGKDMVVAVFKIENGPNQGRKIFNNFVVTPDNEVALAFFFRHMASLGLNEAFFATNPSMAQVASALVGRRARLKVSIRQWNEQDRNQVDAVMPPLDGGAAVAAPAPAGTPAMPTVAAPTPTAPAPAPVAALAPTPAAPASAPVPAAAPTVPITEVPPAPGLPF